MALKPDRKALRKLVDQLLDEPIITNGSLDLQTLTQVERLCQETRLLLNDLDDREARGQGYMDDRTEKQARALELHHNYPAPVSQQTPDHKCKPCREAGLI